jgi:hypothetical protein
MILVPNHAALITVLKIQKYDFNSKPCFLERDSSEWEYSQNKTISQSKVVSHEILYKKRMSNIDPQTKLF